jgi:hypothetical protein
MVRIATLLVVLLCAGARIAAAQNVVTEWNGIMGDTVLTAGTNPVVTSRVAAMVNAAMFDAINGEDRRYEEIVVRTAPGLHLSFRAAAIQAAYEVLKSSYPAQESTLTQRRDASLAALGEKPHLIANGVAWGHVIADAVLQSRSTDGFAPQPVPAFHGAEVTGVWRRTPPAMANGFGIEFASMRPWYLPTPSHYRPSPPHALTSAEYATDYNEVKEWGVKDGSPRSEDQSELVLFWNGNGTLIWNRVAVRLAIENGYDLLATSRLLARLHLAVADAAIACWDSKYRFVFWRPITAIRLGDTDNNADTAPDINWTPWLAATPAHPEYLSGHSTLSGAAAYVLAEAFGEETTFWVDTDVKNLKKPMRTFDSFADALAEIVNARVFGGIHFRTACARGNAVGFLVAQYVLENAVVSRRGKSDK